MAPQNGEVPSFDDIIKRGKQLSHTLWRWGNTTNFCKDREDRERKKNQDLANQLLGRGRKEKVVQNGSRKFSTGGSLASRVGIAKVTSQRSLSSTARPPAEADSQRAGGFRGHENGRQRAPRSAQPNPMSERAKTNLLSEALAAKGATNQGRIKSTDVEINIRGAAGPYVVIASNFAPGTTAADIESAMVPNSGEIQSCRIITASPTVMAEMLLTEKQSAESVIETFNNKKADGRILHVYMKSGGPTPVANGPPARKSNVEPQPSPIDLTRSDPSSTYDRQREQSDRNRRRAEPSLQDGRYGFEGKDDQMEVDQEEPPPAPIEQVQRPPRPDGYHDERYRRGSEQRYGAPPRDFARERNGYYSGRWGGGRPSNDRRLYSDGFNPRHHGYR